MERNKMGEVVKAKAKDFMGIVKQKAPIYWGMVRTKTTSTWNSGTKGKVICIGVATGILVLLCWMFGGSNPKSQDGGTRDQAQASQNQPSKFKGVSPIKGLMGYKLGEVFTGKLGNPAILIGEDWYCVDNRAEFHGYNTCIKILPRTKKICAIAVFSTDVGIDIKTELSTIEAMLRKKYKDIEFQKVSEIVSMWEPKEGSCALFVGLMRHPLGPCVKIEVRDFALEPLIDKEKSEILQERGRAAAEQAGDVL